MSTSLLDIELVLAPISGPNAAGEDIRYDAVILEIEEAMRADDLLPKGEWSSEQKIADWPKVLDLALQTLTERSKDLRVACWLAVALAHLHGTEGVNAGLRLLEGLLRRYWEGLFPSSVEDGLDERRGRIAWLNTQLATVIRSSPITESFEGATYSLMRLEEARHVDNLRRKDPALAEQAIAEGKISIDMFDKAVTATSDAFYLELSSAIASSQSAYKQLSSAIIELFSEDTPELVDLQAAIDECEREVDAIMKDRNIGRDWGRDAKSDSGDARPVTSQEPLTGEIRSRADALRQLGEVADFFRRTEPHSPVSYLVDRAVRWGNMPLDQWLRDVIKEDATLSQLRELLGLGTGEGD